MVNLAASVLDVAVDGWAVDILREDELSAGNAAQVCLTYRLVCHAFKANDIPRHYPQSPLQHLFRWQATR